MKKLTRRDFLRTSALTGAAAALAGAMPLAASAASASSTETAVDEENSLFKRKAKVGPIYEPQDVAVAPQQMHITGGDIMGYSDSVLCSGTGRWRDWRPHGNVP